MKKFNNMPTRTIALKNLKDFTEIKSIFRKEKITRYIYEIRYLGKVEKIGIQWKIQEPADRIYTQIGHMTGWTRPLLERSKKTTGKAIAELMQKVDPENFHKDNVDLVIYDFSDFQFENSDSQKAIYAEMQNAEEFLKEEYYKQYGRYPRGNIKQEGFRVVSSNKDAWNACFY